jgi:hypothetical protein
VLVSLCYGLICWLLEFVVLRVRSEEFELEILVLRHELAILKRTTRRPAITAVDRVLLVGRQPAHAARALAGLHRHVGDAAALCAWRIPKC